MVATFNAKRSAYCSSACFPGTCLDYGQPIGEPEYVERGLAALRASFLGIGEFTIYDWGNGAAAEAYSRMLDHYGKKFILEKEFNDEK